MDFRKDVFMESVKMETEKTGKKKIDRIILAPETMTILNNLIHQAEKALGDLAPINTKTIANFILRKRSSSLTEDELNELRSENHDVIKALRKATLEAIKMKQEGSQIDLNELLKILQTPSVKTKSPTTKPRSSKKSKKDSNLENTQEITQPDLIKEE